MLSLRFPVTVLLFCLTPWLLCGAVTIDAISLSTPIESGNTEITVDINLSDPEQRLRRVDVTAVHTSLAAYLDAANSRQIVRSAARNAKILQSLVADHVYRDLQEVSIPMDDGTQDLQAALQLALPLSSDSILLVDVKAFGAAEGSADPPNPNNLRRATESFIICFPGGGYTGTAPGRRIRASQSTRYRGEIS